MQTTIPINLGSARSDEDFTEGDISINPIRWRSTGNQPLLNREDSSAFRVFLDSAAWEAYSDHLAIIDGLPVELSSERINCGLSGWITQSGDLDAETIVINPPDFVPSDRGLLGLVNTGFTRRSEELPYVSAIPNVSRPTSLAHMQIRAYATHHYPSYRAMEQILGEITEYYQEQLDIKDSEIRALSNELSEMKKENEYQKHESEQIKNQYREEITKIPEVQQAMYKENVKELQFIIMFSDPKKALSDEVYEIENKLEKKYPDWSLDFQYIGPRKYPEKLKEKYNLL